MDPVIVARDPNPIVVMAWKAALDEAGIPGEVVEAMGHDPWYTSSMMPAILGQGMTLKSIMVRPQDEERAAAVIRLVEDAAAAQGAGSPDDAPR